MELRKIDAVDSPDEHHLLEMFSSVIFHCCLGAHTSSKFAKKNLMNAHMTNVNSCLINGYVFSHLAPLIHSSSRGPLKTQRSTILFDKA
jgi:hypothetical protein